VILINGRISDHSYSGYSKLRVFTRPLLAQVDLLCVQSEDDRQKLASLGADPARLNVVGSAKYDMTPANGDGEEKRAPPWKPPGFPATGWCCWAVRRGPAKRKLCLMRTRNFARR